MHFSRPYSRLPSRPVATPWAIQRVLNPRLGYIFRQQREKNSGPTFGGLVRVESYPRSLDRLSGSTRSNQYGFIPPLRLLCCSKLLHLLSLSHVRASFSSFGNLSFRGLSFTDLWICDASLAVRGLVDSSAESLCCHDTRRDITLFS